LATTPSFIKPQDLNLVLKLLRKNWWILAIALTTAIGIKYYQWYKKPVVYNVSTELLLRPDETKTAGIGDAYTRYAQQSITNEQKNNQERIIRSYDLVANTLDKLDFEQSYFLVGRIKRTETFNKQFKIAVNYVAPKYINNRFIFEILGNTILVHLFKTNGDELVKTFPVRAILADDEISLEIIPKEATIAELAQRLAQSSVEIQIHSKGSLVDKYRNKIQLNQPDRTSIFQLSISEEATEKAKVFLDTLIDSYKSFSVRDRLIKNEKTTDFIENQLELVANIINRNEFELENYKKQESIFDITKEESRFYELYLTLEKTIKDYELKVKSLQNLKEYIAKQNKSKLLPPLDFVPDDAFLTDALKELYEMQKRRGQELFEVNPNNPLVSKNDSAFNLLRQDLYKYIENSVVFLNEQISLAQEKQNTYEKQLRSLPKSQREILNISRKIQINEKLYNYLLERRASNIIEKSTIGSDIEVVDSPRTTGRITPSKSTFIKSGFFIGLIIAIAIGALRFFFFDKIEDLEELKYQFEGTVAGGLPSFPNIYSPKDADFLTSDQSEAFRRIRTNLKFLGLNSVETQVVLTTSMFPSEGKTFTSANLAYLFAYSGKKTLLIDVDLHKPRVHKALDIENTKGISLVLSGNETVRDQIQHLSEHMHVITSGPIPPNASELILGGGINDIIAELKGEYDIIFVDTPPLHLITDAQILMDISDINLLVLNTKKASRSTVKDIEEIFRKPVHGKNALILNEIKTTKIGRYLGKYNYKYAYRYGYGAYSYKNHKS